MTDRHDVTAWLPTVSVPVPVGAGADDRIVPLSEARSMLAANLEARPSFRVFLESLV